MNKILGIIITIAVIAGGYYMYITRPVKSPTVVEENANTEVVSENQEKPLGKISGDSVEIRSIGMGLNNQSRAEFKLNEVLRGVPTVVVGSTNNLTGDIVVTFAPASLKLENIKINARTLKTDSTQRDGAVSRMILHTDTDANEFITLENAVATDLPTVIVRDTKFTFTVTGDLKINGITKKTTFAASGIVSKDNTFTGDASAVVKHSDFGISIPNFPFLANVDDQSVLNIYFSAK